MNPVLGRALSFIRSAQEQNGGFSSLSSPSPFFTDAISYRTTFVPSLILGALADVTDADPIRTNISTFLLAERSPHWSWNYWTHDSPERKTMPYPDDLDDTFCALIGLYRHDPSSVDAATLASIVKLLIATETKPGGPYRTWLVPAGSDPVWQDVDQAVNANIAHFLGLIGSPLPSLDEFLERSIDDHIYISPYYPTGYPLFYYLARHLKSPGLVADILERQTDGHWQTPLQTALAMSALTTMNADVDVSIAQKYLERTQLPDGSWPAEAFCMDPARNEQIHYNGAAALTTAFAAGALHSLYATPALPIHITRKVSASESLYSAIYTQVCAFTEQLGGDLGTSATKFARDLLDNDTHGIALLPYQFWKSCIHKSALPDELFVHLGMANVFGWMAYTIYDDFLDEEGTPALLPAANVAMRASLVQFRTVLPAHTNFQRTVLNTFDTIDRANAWEITHCRAEYTPSTIMLGALPDFGDLGCLAERSLGHVLTPLGVLAALGIDPSNPTAYATECALRHYIIARQLSDDLHDWENDVRAGHITYVVAAILHDLHVRPGTHGIEQLIARMQTQFWNYTLPSVCDTIVRHVAMARSSQPTLLPQESIIGRLLDGIESVIARTRTEQTQARTFIASYSK